ncbi:MAG: ABC transporter ATP-binding protein [Myxococcota bacterium]|nr:ABC transporter ATP-binding protein [Myxococcota bacterium]
MTTPALRASGIHKRFQDGDETRHVLKGVDLSLEEGETVALVGPSGSGKTSLLNILGALDPDYDGGVFIGGHRLSDYNDTRLAELRNEHLGFVFQGFNLLNHYSVLDNCALAGRFSPLGVDDERARFFLERVGLKGLEHKRPPTLSGGERQRVAIARALYQNPRVVLCDEPTGNLDSGTAQEILRLFEELRDEGTTFLMVTHDNAVAEVAHRTLRLVEGRLR